MVGYTVVVFGGSINPVDGFSSSSVGAGELVLGIVSVLVLLRTCCSIVIELLG